MGFKDTDDFKKFNRALGEVLKVSSEELKKRISLDHQPRERKPKKTSASKSRRDKQQKEERP